MSPTPEARAVRRLRERRGRPLPTSPGGRLLWILLTGDTQFCEGGFATFGVIRGALMLPLRATAFGPMLTPLMTAVMPIEAWAVGSILPGLLQLAALASGRVRDRRWAAYSNVGFSSALAMIWFLQAPRTLGVAFYGFLAVMQMVIALRLAAEPEGTR